MTCSQSENHVLSPHGNHGTASAYARPLGILIPWKDLRLRLQASKASTLMGRASHGRGGRPELYTLEPLYAILSSYFNYIPISMRCIIDESTGSDKMVILRESSDPFSGENMKPKPGCMQHTRSSSALANGFAGIPGTKPLFEGHLFFPSPRHRSCRLAVRPSAAAAAASSPLKFCKFVRLMDELMCRGDIPFCSEECRQEQIEMDEGKEKKWKLSLKATSRKDSNKGGSPTSPPNSHKVHVRTGTAVAAALCTGKQKSVCRRRTCVRSGELHEQMVSSLRTSRIRRCCVRSGSAVLKGARLEDQDQEVSTDTLTRRGCSRRGRATQSRTVRVPHRRRRAVVDLASIEEESSAEIACNRVNGHRLDRLYVRANLGDHAEEARGWWNSGTSVAMESEDDEGAEAAGGLASKGLVGGEGMSLCIGVSGSG
ncbi:hypothetical protein GW17_00054584 [Ensete ventricosum]|nr:hypothetical protein GW17_00054584 [Ensete ventricosum]